MGWYISVIQNYAVFSGRACRSEYWFFVLFSSIIYIVLAVIDAMIGTLSADLGLGLLSGIYSLAVLVPGIAVTVRRLHDSGKTGFLIFVGLIPFVGALILLIFMVLGSSPDANKYGS